MRSKTKEESSEGSISPALRLQAARARRRPPGDGAPPGQPGPSGSINWTPIGPSAQAKSYATGNPTVSGRVPGIAVRPGSSRVYVGAENGGVWQSLDAGLTWTPLEDLEVAPSTSAPPPPPIPSSSPRATRSTA